jgi:threonine-phosphate decarboxylase
VALASAPMHGGNVHAAARELGRPIKSLVDFSASINPLGPSPRALRALLESVPLVEHYPDPHCVSLRRAIERRWRIDSDRIVVANGATELIDLIPRALSMRSALIVGPTYAEYARSVEQAGGRFSMVMAKQEDEYRPPLDEVAHRLVRPKSGRMAVDAVFICHPNSPTGRPASSHDLQVLLAAANRAGVWVIVDESFIDYCQALTCVLQLRRYRRLIVLRSFTKFYGLPGLRIGYSLSSTPVAEALRRYQPPWTVNAVAQLAAEAAMADTGHAKRCLTYVARERARMARRLSSIQGVTVFPSATNFLLIELPRGVRSSPIAAALRRKGLLIRDCSSIQGCSARMLRVAVRKQQDNDRLLAVLAGTLQK